MQTIYLKSPMKEEFKKYIKKEKYNPDIDKTEIWIGNFSSDPTIDPIDIICKIIPHFQNQDNKIIINDFLQYNNKKNWKIPLIFKNITFNKDLQFIFNSFDYKVKFINCIFMKNVLFGSCHFEENVEFAGCVFSQNTDFTCSVFNQKSNFLSTKFEGLKNDFSKIHFNKDTSFENIKVKSDINFSDSIFEENVCFENAAFEGNIRFHESIFEETANFTNTKFQKLVDFYLAKFHKAQQFHLTDFLDRAIFSSIEFDEEVQFLHCKVDSNSYIRFESATFKKSLDISRSNFNDKANFWNIELEEGDAFTSSKYQNDFSEKAKTESTKNTPTIYKKIRETYRIIKSNFYSQNNKIEGLKFYEKEMSVYLEEKRAEDKKSDSTNKFTLRNLNLENKIDSFFTNKSAIIKKKLTSFCSFFLCFYQNILLPSYELFPFIEIFKSILSQFKETFKEVFSFLYKPFYIILYIIVIFFKEFRNRNITLYRSSFCIMILFFFLHI